MFKRAAIFISVFVLTGSPALAAFASEPAVTTTATTTNSPGEHGRVLVVQDSRATAAFSPDQEIVRKMFRQGLLRFTGKQSLDQAWRSLVSTQDIIGLKVHSAPGPNTGTRPAVVAEVIASLLEAGFDPGRIIIWDRRLTDLRPAGYFELGAKYHVAVAAALEEGYDRHFFYSPTPPLLGRLVAGDLEFMQKGEDLGRKSYVTTLLTRKITKIINITPLLNHNYAGVSGAMYDLALSAVDNTLRFEGPDRLATALPEIYALPEVGDRVALNLVDALICQYRGEDRPALHYAAELNELWFSTDAVAVDVLGIETLDRFRGDSVSKKVASQIYMNAALMDLGIADSNQIKVERLNLR